jgi:beta-N-acetylhexosaminidase
MAPFQAVIHDPSGPEVIMTAHVLYPSLDPDMPATLSRKILIEILRREMGFKGVILTDDLEMKAIMDRVGPEEASFMAVKAGADLLMFCHNPSYLPQCLDFIIEAVNKGFLNETRIEESLRRIRILKERYLRKKLSPEDQRLLMEKIGCKEHRAIAEEVSRFHDDVQKPS